jgi:dihydropteroate synthase
MIWQTSRFQLDLTHPKVMGIVNVTPDSFSDGGKFDAPTAGMAHCEKLVADGADILDLGAESSRPGAPSLSAEEEWARLNPVLKGALSLGVPVSVDTCKTEVMRRALDMGADIVNDIRALMAPGALEVVASHASCGVCLMHMKGEPGTMQKQAHYSDVIEEVCVFLGARVQAVKALQTHASRWTRAWALASRHNTTCCCWRASKSSRHLVCHCCSAGPESPPWVLSQAAL